MADEKELKDQRVPIMMTPSELEAIDDWMFKNRIRSRGEAIRRLCQMGLVTQQNKLMHLAINVLTHYVKDADADLMKEFRTGNPLEKDVKRLCWAVMKLESSLVGFQTDKEIADAIKMVKTLDEQYRETAKGSFIE